MRKRVKNGRHGDVKHMWTIDCFTPRNSEKSSVLITERASWQILSHWWVKVWTVADECARNVNFTILNWIRYWIGSQFSCFSSTFKPRCSFDSTTSQHVLKMLKTAFQRYALLQYCVSVVKPRANNRAGDHVGVSGGDGWLNMSQCMYMIISCTNEFNHVLVHWKAVVECDA